MPSQDHHAGGRVQSVTRKKNERLVCTHKQSFEVPELQWRLL